MVNIGRARSICVSGREQGMKMETLLRVICLVSVPATYFDIPGTPQEDKWSVATFGEKWDSERCHGTVLKVLSGGQFARVR